MGQPRDPFVEWTARLGRPGPDAYELLGPARSGGSCPEGAELARVADQLGWPVAAVTGTATYYADLADAPTGRRHIRACEGTSCFVSGGGRQLAELERTLGVRRGERAPDGSVSVQTVRCLGYCYASPAALDGGRARTGRDLGGLLAPSGAAASGAAAQSGAARPGAQQHPAPPIPYASAVERPVSSPACSARRGRGRSGRKPSPTARQNRSSPRFPPPGSAAGAAPSSPSPRSGR